MSDNRFSVRDTVSKRRMLLHFFSLVSTFFILVFNTHGVVAAVVYSTGFEASEGYTANLNLVGQNGWVQVGSGGNGLITGEFPGQGQQAYIGFSSPAPNDDSLFVYQPINKDLPSAQFSVTMSVFDSTNANWDDFHWDVYNQDGDLLFGLGFDNFYTNVYYYLDSTNSRVSTGLEFANGIAYPLSLALDFANNLWSATFNGALLATNQPITTLGSPLNLGDIDAGWVVFDPNNPGNNYMVFDNYLITASLPSPRLRLLGVLNRAPVLRLSGTPDMAFAIEASTNLASWTPLKTNIAEGGSFDYVDDGAVGLPRRFYRARWVP
jgi:hypothetical protein